MSLVVEERPHALAHVPEDLLAPSDLARCLSAVLWVMGWSGGADDLIAALPHAKPDIDLTDLRNTLAVLGYPTRMERLSKGRLDLRCLPALLLTKGRGQRSCTATRPVGFCGLMALPARWSPARQKSCAGS